MPTTNPPLELLVPVRGVAAHGLISVTADPPCNVVGNFEEGYVEVRTVDVELDWLANGATLDTSLLILAATSFREDMPPSEPVSGFVGIHEFSTQSSTAAVCTVTCNGQPLEAAHLIISGIVTDEEAREIDLSIDDVKRRLDELTLERRDPEDSPSSCRELHGPQP